MTGPLPKYDVYDLTDNQVVTFPNGAPMDPFSATPEAVKAAPDALLPKKPKGRPHGSKNKKAKAKAKKAKAPAVVPVPETPKPVIAQRLVASGGDGMLAGLRRAPSLVWLVVAAVALMLAIGTALAFVLPPISMR